MAMTPAVRALTSGGARQVATAQLLLATFQPEAAKVVLGGGFADAWETGFLDRLHAVVQEYESFDPMI